VELSPKKHTPDRDHADHDHDPEACLCDMPLEAGAETGDADLPEAVGGIALLAGTQFDETVDGCDLDFTRMTTADADLPAATGGVA
jgi:hypothetical protein